MDAINKKIAVVVLFIGVALSVLMLTTKLTEQNWFIFLFVLWIFVFCSCCYRLTPLFKTRNQVNDFIKRDAKHLVLFSLAGFFDKKSGPQWLAIKNIKHLSTRNNELLVHSYQQTQFSISLPASKVELDAFLQQILTNSERRSITFD